MISAGTVTTGAVVRVGDGDREGVLPVLSAVSVAVQVTVVAPTGKVLPEAGAQIGVRAPSTLSTAVTVKGTTAPLGPVAGAVMSAGTVTTGAVVSMSRFLLAPSEPAAPGAASVKTALFVAASLIDPPLSSSDVVAA